jgi:hypothetical protein
MFTADVAVYEIDLTREERSRWDEVAHREKAVAAELVREAGAQLERVPELVRWVFARLYQWSGGLYQGEIAAWAKALGVSPGTATVLNCAYELSHLRWPRAFGCTAGVRWVQGAGMVHVRSLDWPLAALGAATRVFRFHRGAREFVAVGAPGHVGVLSGMLPRAYSVTINWAPPAARPCFDFGPAFLLRHVLETCDDYDAAVRVLSETHLSTSVFFLVCGIENEQACVIERTQREAVVRPMDGPVLVQANHHVAVEFAANNKDLLDGAQDDDVFSLAGSVKRSESLGTALAGLPVPGTPGQLVKSLNAPPVLNSDSCQQMVFCPATGEAWVWRGTQD